MIKYVFNRFQWNPFEKHIAKIEKLMLTLERLESMGGNPLEDLTDQDKINAVETLKKLEEARSILRNSNKER